jgi:hypothetical protein
VQHIMAGCVYTRERCGLGVCKVYSWEWIHHFRMILCSLGGHRLGLASDQRRHVGSILW